MIDSSRSQTIQESLLATKLYAPAPRQSLIARPHLVARIAAGVEQKLTVVSAPAGYGKTTLVTEWLASSSAYRNATAWVSLDVGDNDPTLFWSYLIAGLQTLTADIGSQTLPLLYAAQPAPITTVLTALINELNAINRAIVLVLDDYHIIENEEIHKALAYFISHLPSHVHLIIASRAELPIPTGRLRAHGELTTLVINDLKFSETEVQAFFNGMLNQGLSAEALKALSDRTEGWIAGLQLAGLSLKERDDVSAFVASFAGQDRYIADFLVEEVLANQPERVRRFLIATAVLDRMQGPLCDALTGSENGFDMLERLEKQNLFVISLDSTRTWYRYHHLFADALRAILAREQPAHVATLHGRASAWYETQGLYAEAIHHAKAASDAQRVARLVERVADTMYTGAQTRTLYTWLAEIPAIEAKHRPVLLFWIGWAALERGEFERAMANFDAMAAGFSVTNEKDALRVQLVNGFEAVDQDQLNRLPGRMETVQAIFAQTQGDLSGGIVHAQEALKLLPADDTLWRGGSTVLLGLTSWAQGDLETAYHAIAEGFTNVEKLGGVHFLVSGTHLMADIRVAQGRLKDALALYARSISLAEAESALVRGLGDQYLCTAEILIRQGAFDLAIQHFEKGRELGEDARNIELRHRWVAFDALREALLGKFASAEALYAEADRQYVPGPVPLTRPFSARIARLWLQQGQLARVGQWVDDEGMTPEDALSFLNEYNHVTYARWLIAQYSATGNTADYHTVQQFLLRLMEAATAGGRIGRVIEIKVLAARADVLAGKRQAALLHLERALVLAAGEQYVQVFADEGETLRDLLGTAVAEGIGGAFARELYEKISGQKEAVSVAQRGGDSLLVPLSAREIEVLRLIAAGMKNQEISDQLFISLATVKRHISNIYGKLEVSRRTEAVAKANALGIL